MTGVNEIRSTFLNYFASNDHEIIASSPLVPRNDPTLMFANAGMVQFKNVFTGAETRPYKRATTSQKCVRAGGKHNDLDNVGYTTRHHTFFEMLGNFSFGDYFKDRAIELAWNLITREYSLDPKRLMVTVYAEDNEAYDLWRKIAGLPESKIARIATHDNFWAMGDTGPCGPCSEIFFDHGDKIPGGPPGSPDEDGDRFIEIWNLVFMQYEQVTPDERIALPRPSIDTGMGLERISAVLQGTHDNYAIDLFQALIEASVEATGAAAVGDNAVSHRVIADHLRATSFLISDGVMPSNEGRGYVLRRIMRRAMRHANLLGSNEPVIYKLVPTLVQEMGQAFPELARAQALVTETIKLEESRFQTTLDRGLKLLGEATDDMVAGDVLPGEVAFKLYDTYGFPLDLTEDALKPRGIEVDQKGFSQAMEHQRSEARRAWSGSGEAAEEKIWFDLHEKLGATEFLGYGTDEAEGEILALVVDGQLVGDVSEGDNVALIVNQTPFYGESGGQVGDSGIIQMDNSEFRVTDTQKKAGDLFLHLGRVEKGSFSKGDAVVLEIDAARRTATRANHSATHLIHKALRQVLGDHVAQKGSLVAPDRLRFDFSHSKSVSDDELKSIEGLANKIIRQNGIVETRLMAVDEAIASGALALFGEKYGDEVRVVSMGTETGSNGPGHAYSVELCGGTHVRRTGDIGVVKLIGESAVAAGVRRIEALTGEGALNYIDEQVSRVRDAAELLKSKREEIVPRIEALLDERKRLERDLAKARRDIAMGGSASDGGDPVTSIGDIKLLARTVTGITPKDLRGLVDDGKGKVGSGIVAIVGVGDDGKAGLVVGVTKDLTDRFDAVKLVRAGAEALGGKGGGGRSDYAQAGGPDGNQAQNALNVISECIAELSKAG